MENEKRLIDADVLIGRFCELANKVYAEGNWFHLDAITDEITDAPTVDAAEVVHGRWISSGCGFDCCSKCRMVYADGYLTAMGIKPRTQFNYCPNCGAKMDGDGNG